MTAPINFGDLFKNSKGALDALPDGDYDMKIIDAQPKIAGTGSHMIVAKFEVTSGPHIKRRVNNNFVLKEDNMIGLAIFFRDMETLGIPGSFFESNPNLQTVAEAMRNRVCRVTLGTRTWQGRDINDVKAILPASATVGPVAPGTVTGPPVNVLSGAPSVVSTSPATHNPGVPPIPTVTPPNPTAPVINAGPKVNDGPPAPTPPAF